MSCDITEALTSRSQMKSYSLFGLKGSSFTTQGIDKLSRTITKAQDKIERFASAHSFEYSAHHVI